MVVCGSINATGGCVTKRSRGTKDTPAYYMAEASLKGMAGHVNTAKNLLSCASS